MFGRFRVDISKHGVFSLGRMALVDVIKYMAQLARTYRRDLLRQLDLLCESHLSCIQRTFQINVGHLVAQISCLLDQSDQSIFDHQVDVSSLLDWLIESSTGRDREDLAATIQMLATGSSNTHSATWRHLRLGRVGREIDLVDLEDVLGRGVTVGERVVSLDWNGVGSVYAHW